MNQAVSHDSACESDQVLGQIATEYFDRLAAGEAPSIAEFIRRFPEHAEAIAKVLPALQRLTDSVALGDVSAQEHCSSPTPRMLGDFRIVSELGRGGMGIVYEAQQISMGNRSVALKILPFAAIVNETQLHRFRNEVRAAASLNHPNIVSVYLVGEERGIHYYAMQLIRGQSTATLIDGLRQLRNHKALDEKSISTVLADGNKSMPRGFATQHEPEFAMTAPAESNSPREIASRSSLVPPEEFPQSITNSTRAPCSPTTQSTVTMRRAQAVKDTLRGNFSHASAAYQRSVAELARQAALALQHAHERGVVHRDIKPANLLVDSQAKLYITDFGLAQIEEDAGFTMTGDLIGTLRYMSPEQASGNKVAVDHRTDIYSLGITIYELLTTRYAFDGQDRLKILRQITSGELRTLRHVENSVARDLETIVHKAAAKDAADRYQSAQDLANDLSAFLEHRTISAHPPTISDRCLKWSVRNKRIVLASSGVMLLAVVSLTAAVVMISHANHTAKQEARKAKEEATISEQVLKFLNEDLLGGTNPENEPNRELTVREVLERASAKINKQFQEQPLVAASVHRSLALAWKSLGKWDRAEEHITEAIQHCRSSKAEVRTLLENEEELASIWNLQGKLDASRALLEDVVSRAIKEFGEDDIFTLNARWRLGEIYVQGHNPGVREISSNMGGWEGVDLPTYMRELTEDAIRVLGHDSHLTMNIKYRLGLSLINVGQLDNAETVFVELQRSAEVKYDNHPIARVKALGVLGEIRCASKNPKKREQGLADLRAFLELNLKLNRPGDIQTAGAKLSLAKCLNWHYGYISSESEGLWRKGLSELRQTLGDDHPDVLSSYRQFCLALSEAKRYRESEELLAVLVNKFEAVFGESHPQTLRAILEYANVQTNNDKYPQALANFQEVFQRSRAEYGFQLELTSMTYYNILWLLGLLNRHEEQLQFSRKVANDFCAASSDDYGSSLYRRYTQYWLAGNAYRLVHNSDADSASIEQAARLLAELGELSSLAGGAFSLAQEATGISHYRLHAFPEALACYEQVNLRSEEVDARCLFFRAMAHWQLGNRSKAEELFLDAAARLDVQWSPNDEDRQASEEAQELLGLSDEQRRKLVDQRLADVKTTDPSRYPLSGVWDYRCGRYSQALQLIRAKLHSAPGNLRYWDVWNQIALEHYAQIGWESLDAESTLAMELASDRPELLVQIFPLLLLANQSDAYHRQCQLLLDKADAWYGPDLFSVALMCVLDPLALPDDERITRLFQRAAELQLPRRQLAQAIWLARLGKNEEANTQLDALASAGINVDLLRSLLAWHQSGAATLTPVDSQLSEQLAEFASDDPIERIYVAVISNPNAMQSKRFNSN